MFLLIKDNHTEKATILGNIYRPQHENNNKENIQTFVSELNPVLSRLSENNRDFIMAGDYNINLLHINYVNKEHFSNFLDLMLGYSMFPKIIFPTRFSDNGNSCSLIDNIFCKLSSNNISAFAGILLSRISDHCPVFVTFNSAHETWKKEPSKYIKKRINNKEEHESFLADRTGSNIVAELNPDPLCNPNENYDKFHDHLAKLKDKHLSYKLVKFNKYKHRSSNWITHRVLHSIKYRDGIYNKSAQGRWVVSADRIRNEHILSMLSVTNGKSQSCWLAPLGWWGWLWIAQPATGRIMGQSVMSFSVTLTVCSVP